jgi:hypothetical protein
LRCGSCRVGRQHGGGKVLLVLVAQVVDPSVVSSLVVQALLDELVPVPRVADDLGPVPDQIEYLAVIWTRLYGWPTCSRWSSTPRVVELPTST